MEMSSMKNTYLFFFKLILLWFQIQVIAQADSPYIDIPVGVILDMGSSVGKTVHSCISMAVSEFYTINNHYKTRIVLHSRDTHGEPLHALSAALDLLEKPKVQAILGSQSTAEAKFLAVLGDQTTTPIVSLSPVPSSNKHPYFLQITQDETTQVKAIASMAFSFGWKNAIIIFEDTESGREMATFMTNSLQEKSITITYMSAISTSPSYDVLLGELHKISNMQTKLYILHVSHSLASHLFNNAKYPGMMDAGCKWIVTSKTMNFLNIMNDEVIELMQGVVGFKSHIPQSRELHKFRMKWRKEYHVLELKDINAFAMSAYDGVSALAMAVEKTQSVIKVNTKDLGMIGSAQWRTILLNQMMRISFDGLSGSFKFLNARVTSQVLEIINVIGKEEVKVGFWTTDVAAFTKNISKLNSFPSDGLEPIMWPGGILDNPTHRMLQVTSRRLRIGIPMPNRTRPFFVVKHDAQTNSTIVSGFCSDVFIAAFARVDPSVSFQFIPTERVSYDGLVYRVHEGEFDAAIGDISIIANRSRYVDFTLPYTDLGVATLTLNADATASLWIFMKPLSSDLWLVSACFFILLGFVIWILEHETNEEFQGSLGRQVGTALWFAFSTLVYAHRQKLESNLSRFVVTVWLFVVLVLVSSYTATLSSLLTVEQIQLASKRGLIGYQNGLQGVIGSNWKFHDYRLESYHTLEEIANALSKGSKKGGAVDAVIYEIPYIKEFLALHPFGYSMVLSEDITNGFGFAFPKGSNWTLEISRQIASLRADGTLQKLDDKWFGQKSDSLSKDSAPKILNFEGLRGLFLISGISMAAALFVFMLRYIHEKVHYTYAKLAGGKLAFILKFLFLKVPFQLNEDDPN
ncbi:glutamate receptor 1.2-like [Bidens hawaiensis]|uniref:glutamate receptor 1.2-like n=1 Tax=Bidens hawaiensis TaxID=980011 RepID=UPI00404B0AE9